MQSIIIGGVEELSLGMQIAKNFNYFMARANDNTQLHTSAIPLHIAKITILTVVINVNTWILVLMQSIAQ